MMAAYVCVVAYSPSALGVARYIMLQAVLLNLQGVVEGAIQFLYRHFNGALWKAKKIQSGSVEKYLQLS